MGSKMGPNYAYLFVEYVEEKIATKCNGFVPPLHKRYNDDVIGVACCGRVELENHINFVCNFHPAIHLNLRTPFLTLNSPCSTSRYALVTTTSALPFITRKLIHTLFFSVITL